MDYKDKYIKYKIKYLELKNIIINNQTGGGKKLNYKNNKVKKNNRNKNKKMSISNVESINIVLEKLELIMIQNLNSGWNGDSFIVKNNKDELLVLKLERMDKYNENNKFESEYYRQIDFNKLVARKYPNKFTVLEDHGIIENCVFSHSKTDEVMKSNDEKRKARFIRKNSQSNCYYLLYKPVLDGTFKSVKDEVKNNEELLLDFLIQIIESINIYRKLGFIHTDVNITNIMFKKNGDVRYQWYWIDYGNITNNKYPDSLLDIERKEEQPYYKINMMNDLIGIVQNFCMTSSIVKHRPTRIQQIEFIKTIEEKHKDKYDKIIKYLPITELPTRSLFVLIFKILFPQEYSNYYEIEYDNMEQIIKNKILLCIKHSNDETYDDLINLIKK